MNADSFPLTPDPEFIALLSEYLPHKRRISRRLPNGNTQEEILQGTNFMEDVMRVYQKRLNGPLSIFDVLHEIKYSMWTQPYIEEVKAFLETHNLSTDLLGNIWLLRCRIYFSLEEALYNDKSRVNHESEQTKRINFINNHVLPFIKAIQGDIYLSHRDDNVHSVSFKTNKPGVKTLKLTGHLANTMYYELQQMAYDFLESNKSHNPDLQTNRFKTGIGIVTKGSYHILRNWGAFAPTSHNRPTSAQLEILEDLIELGVSNEGLISRMAPNSSTKEYLRKFFY